MFEGFRSYRQHKQCDVQYIRMIRTREYLKEKRMNRKKSNDKSANKWNENILDVWYQHCVYIWVHEVFDTPKIVHDHRIDVAFEWCYLSRRPSNVCTSTLAEMRRSYCCPGEIHPTNRLHSHDSCALISVVHDKYALHAQLTEMVAPIFLWPLWRYSLYPAPNCTCCYCCFPIRQRKKGK